jgi:hypothetical protein
LGQLRKWTSLLYSYAPRKLPLHAVISETVYERMRKARPAYAPQSLLALVEELDKKRDNIDAQLSRLVEAHSISPEERDEIAKRKDELCILRWPPRPQDSTRVRSPDGSEKRLTNEAFAAAPMV